MLRVPTARCAAVSHQVTAPQLSLLEAAMARMERVAVWSLMSGGGGGRDVFTVRQEHSPVVLSTHSRSLSAM